MKTLAKIGRARAIVRYFRDPDASLLGKLFVFAALAYVVCPVDVIPDVVPFVGWLDDIGVMSLAVAWMWKIVGRYREAPALSAPSHRPELSV
ncbi:MAG: hypothetical protein JWP87_4973 [Labilithrix sp.]|nr:hypothetical protein [Labilithrix sp.]